MATEILLKGKVAEGFVYHYGAQDKAAVAGEEVEVDITAPLFLRQWWKLEFAQGKFVPDGQGLAFIPNEEKVIEKPKKASTKKED